MEFNEKLIFLMNITQTTNKELAQGISVDPSLISLLRSGKRKQPQNKSHIENMASFFSKKCFADYQRNALSEMLGQRSISKKMPTEILSNRLERWLKGDSDIADDIKTGIEDTLTKPQTPLKQETVEQSKSDASFYFGEKGRREVMKLMMKMIRETEKPGSLFISSDDNLEWLLSDYAFTKQIQSNLMEIVEKGFTIYQIMPAINFLPRYTEALQFWLPLYSTGKVKVYYYPRIRDNLYRRSMIVLPGRCVRISSAIGLGSSSDVTMFSTDLYVINAHTSQFQEHLAMCRPALSAYSKFEDVADLFMEVSLKGGDYINMESTLSPNTIPYELFQQLINSNCDSKWKGFFQSNALQITNFEKTLKTRQYIDMLPLATAEEIWSGKVYITVPYDTTPEPPVYTPETYILHLENILRLMEQYENYYFIPYHDTEWKNYNLIVNSDGLAILIRTTKPSLIMKMERPELVIACYEHLIRKAEKIGYDGIHKEKHRRTIKALIKELKQGK